MTGAHRPSPFIAGPHGLRVRLKVTPRAASNRVHGLQADADGTVRLKVAVTAPADAGRANSAVVSLLARVWGVAPTRMSIPVGAADRRKTLAIEGNGAELQVRLEGWLTAQGLALEA